MLKQRHVVQSFHPFPHDTIFYSSAHSDHNLQSLQLRPAQVLRITALVPFIMLQARRRRFELALEDIIRNADSQWDAANWEFLTGPSASRVCSYISDIFWILYWAVPLGLTFVETEIFLDARQWTSRKTRLKAASNICSRLSYRD